MYVCLQLFSGMEIARKLILCNMVGYGSGTKPIDFLGSIGEIMTSQHTEYYISRHFGEGGSRGNASIVKRLYKIETCSLLHSLQEMQGFLKQKTKCQ